MKSNAAFTLIELVAVVAILALLAAILAPVYRKAVASAEKSECISNLHQIHLATELYRQDYDGSGRLGNVYVMGLPTSPQPSRIRELEQLKCSSAPHEIDKTLGTGYFTYYIEPDKDGLLPRWEDYALQYGESAVLYGDPFHNKATVSLMFGEHVTRHVLGVSVGGSVLRRSGKGDWMARGWFNQ